MKKKPLIICLLIGNIFCACNWSAAEDQQLVNARGLLNKLMPVAEFVTSDKPLLKEVVQLIGGTPCPDESDPPTCFDRDGYRVIYWLDPHTGDMTTQRAQFMISKVKSGIVFQDIVTIFGKWTMVGPAGKTSNVRFNYTNPRTSIVAAVYVSLYEPPKNQKSPVMEIVIQKTDLDH